MNLSNNTGLKFAVIVVLVAVFTRLILFVLRPLLQFPGGIALLLSLLAGGLAGYFLLYRNKNY